MDRIMFYVLFLAVSILIVSYEYYKMKRKYDALKENHERLKNEMKLLQQENFYLKQFSRLDNTNW